MHINEHWNVNMPDYSHRLISISSPLVGWCCTFIEKHIKTHITHIIQQIKSQIPRTVHDRTWTQQNKKCRCDAAEYKPGVSGRHSSQSAWQNNMLRDSISSTRLENDSRFGRYPKLYIITILSHPNIAIHNIIDSEGLVVFSSFKPEILQNWRAGVHLRNDVLKMSVYYSTACPHHAN